VPCIYLQRAAFLAELRRLVFVSRTDSFLGNFVKPGTRLRVYLPLLEMPPHSQQDGNADCHKGCSAQHQEHKQNLDYHKMSG